MLLVRGQRFVVTRAVRREQSYVSATTSETRRSVVARGVIWRGRWATGGRPEARSRALRPHYKSSTVPRTCSFKVQSHSTKPKGSNCLLEKWTVAAFRLCTAELSTELTCPSTNTGRQTKVILMLGQCRRRWANIGTTLVWRLLFVLHEKKTKCVGNAALATLVLSASKKQRCHLQWLGGRPRVQKPGIAQTPKLGTSCKLPGPGDGRSERRGRVHFTGQSAGRERIAPEPAAGLLHGEAFTTCPSQRRSPLLQYRIHPEANPLPVEC